MNYEIVTEIHEYLVDFFEKSNDPISPPGIKNVGLLQSACARPFMTADGRDLYKDDFNKAAALFHSIIANHCFHNGNKRTALLSTLYFLGECNYWVEKCDDEEMFEFTRQVAAHEVALNRTQEVPEITKWLKRNSRRVIKGERLLTFIGLREALARFGYELVENGTLASIMKDGVEVEKILKKGKQGLEEYDPLYLSKLRRRLKLTVSYGIDSARFYGQKGINEELNQFLLHRGEVFRRLAVT